MTIADDVRRVRWLMADQTGPLADALSKVLPGILDALEVAERERDELRARLNKAVCSWCGTEGPKEPDIMVAHALSCEKRQDALTEAVRENEEMRAFVRRGVQLLDEGDRVIADLRAQVADYEAALAAPKGTRSK